MAILGRIFLLPLVLLALAGPASAQELALAEQKIKVGMLYNFLKYTDWPAAEAETPMQVCLFRGDPFDGNAQAMEGRSVNLRMIHVRAVEDVAAAAGCHLVVVSGDWTALRAALHGKHVLTV